MNKIFASSIIAALISLASALMPADAQAASWQRYPGAFCQGDYNSGSSSKAGEAIHAA